MQKILVSACLVGQPVRYDGRSSGHFTALEDWQGEGRLVLLCPEMAGGLPVPRPAAEIIGGEGERVLAGLQSVSCADGTDVSGAFLAGAAQALVLVKRYQIRMAVLKARSPSCGNQHTYDGSFTGRLVSGSGVTAAALRCAGVAVFNEHELAAAAAFLRRL